MNHPHHNPHLTHLQRLVSNLRVEIPEHLSVELDRALSAYVTTQHQPADLWTHFRCVRCGSLHRWDEEHTEQHGRRHDDYRIIRHLCPECADLIKPT